MSNFKTFFDFYSNQDNIFAQFKEGVPKKEGDKNILFVKPSLTGNNFYKLILPCMIMKNIVGVHTALTGIHPYNPTKRFVSRESPLSSQQILWADTIVFPFVDESLGQCFADIRRINPLVKIVFSMDFNIYTIPDGHPYKKYFETDEQKKVIDTNIVNADEVIVSNLMLEKYLTARLKQFTQKFNTQVVTIPLLFDEMTQTGILEHKEKKPNEKVKIGIIATDAHLAELKSYNTTLKNINKNFGDKAEIIIFGANAKNPEFIKATKGITFTQPFPVPITLYYQRLTELNFDVVILLTGTTEFCNTSDDHKKFIDLALLKVPVITLNEPPYSILLAGRQAAFIAKDKKEIVKIVGDIIKNRATAANMGEAAYQFVQQNYSYDAKNYAKLLQIF